MYKWSYLSSQILDDDNDRQLESPTGRAATRDIVQFVPMRMIYSDCTHDIFLLTQFLFILLGKGGQISVVQATLEELPGQFLSYMCWSRGAEISGHLMFRRPKHMLEIILICFENTKIVKNMYIYQEVLT